MARIEKIVTLLMHEVVGLGGRPLMWSVEPQRTEAHDVTGAVLWERTVGNDVTEFVTHVWRYDQIRERVFLNTGHYLRDVTRAEAEADYAKRRP